MNSIGHGFTHFFRKNFTTGIEYFSTDVYEEDYLDKVRVRFERFNDNGEKDFCEIVLPECNYVAAFGFSEIEMLREKKWLERNADSIINGIKEGLPDASHT